MRLVGLSDTHGRHRRIDVPEGDLLIHAGDISNGRRREAEDFLDWFAALPHPRKIFLAGNMDQALARSRDELLRDLPPNIHYLEQESVELEGLKCWGSPYVPNFVGVFNLPRGEALRAKWAEIPEDVDILITHGPPMGILDQTSRGQAVGCAELRKRVDDLSPRVHLFGHVHESYGQLEKKGTLFINASLPARGYRRFNPPVVLNLET